MLSILRECAKEALSTQVHVPIDRIMALSNLANILTFYVSHFSGMYNHRIEGLQLAAVSVLSAINPNSDSVLSARRAVHLC